MSSANWFAGKLGLPQPAPSSTPPTASPAPAAAVPQTPYQAPSSDFCPRCRSGNYFRPAPSAAARCYNCNYGSPDQSGTSVGTGVTQASSGPATPARQIESGGFNPQTIVGKLG